MADASTLGSCVPLLRERQRSRRKRDIGHRVIKCDRFSKRRLRAIGEEYPERVEHPKTRAECIHGLRPCPYISCKHHLWCDVKASGNIILNFPDLEPDEMVTPSCVLDVVDHNPDGITLERCGEYNNSTREWIRLTEESAKRKLKRNPETPRQVLEWIDDED